MDFTLATKLNIHRKRERKFGHLYYSGSGLTHGEVVLSEPKKTAKDHFVFILSAFIVSFSMTSLLTTFAPSSYVPIPEVTQTTIPEVFAETASLNNTARDEAHALGLTGDFSIAVPKIHAYADIIANVDVTNEAVYDKALTGGVAHAAGTGIPGGNTRMFLFAHSTDSLFNFSKYNAIFYELRKLEVDDSIYVYYEDKKYIYRVTEKKVVQATDVSYLDPIEEPTLILQTCDPPGTTWKRLLVFAKRVE